MKPKNLKDWIVNRERIGLPCFARADVAVAFPDLHPHALDSALSRFCTRGLVRSPHKGFYCVVPPHYALSVELPPHYYIDQMMQWMGRQYYVALLSAASLWGASHQRVGITQVMTEIPMSTTSSRRNPFIDWVCRKRIPKEFVLRKNGENGQISYSNAELTALDLVHYADRAGGISFVSTVLAELKDATNFNGAGIGVFQSAEMTDIQRLGFIFETVLGDLRQAETIHREMIQTGRTVRPALLQPSSSSVILSANRRWHIKVNCEIELDEV